MSLQSWYDCAHARGMSLAVISLCSLSSAALGHPSLATPGIPLMEGMPTALGARIIRSLPTDNYAYFNLSLATSTHTKLPLEKIRQQIQRGRLIILDQTSDGSAQLIDQVSRRLLGVALAKPLLVISPNHDGAPRLYPGEARDAPALTRAIQRDLQSARRDKRSVPPYRAGKTLYIGFNHGPVECWLKRDIAKDWGGYITLSGSIDPCAGQASYNAMVKLEYLPAQNDSNHPNLPDGKIIRISSGASGQPTGAGWHLAHELVNINRSQRSQVHRSTWFGPYADSYETGISVDDSDVSLIDHSPLNSNREIRVSQSNGLELGQGFSANLALGGDGPTVGLSRNVVSTQRSDVTLNYDINEYQVINRTAGNRFQVTWQRAKPPLTLNSAQMIRQGAMPIDSQRFSAIAYANFVPGFSASYRVERAKTGSTRFTATSSAQVMAALNLVRPDQLVDNTLISTTPINWSDTVEIDWDSPYFISEAPVQIKAFNHRRLYCLTMKGLDQEVRGEACGSDNTQLWGLNQNGQYISVAQPGLCLSAQPSADDRLDLLLAQPCNPSGFQEWEWQQKQLLNRRSRRAITIVATSAADNGATASLEARSAEITSAISRDLSTWKPYVRRPE